MFKIMTNVNEDMMLTVKKTNVPVMTYNPWFAHSWSNKQQKWFILLHNEPLRPVWGYYKNSLL
jgi:hypothetical protein